MYLQNATGKVIWVVVMVLLASSVYAATTTKTYTFLDHSRNSAYKCSGSSILTFPSICDTGTLTDITTSNAFDSIGEYIETVSSNSDNTAVWMNFTLCINESSTKVNNLTWLWKGTTSTGNYELTMFTHNFSDGNYYNTTVKTFSSNTAYLYWSSQDMETALDDNLCSNMMSYVPGAAGSKNILSDYVQLDVNITVDPPTFTNATNTSANFSMGQAVNTNISISDTAGISWALLSTNNTGGWVNSTKQLSNGALSYYFNNSFSIGQIKSNNICWQVFANDTLGQVNNSDMMCFDVLNSPPTLLTDITFLNKTYHQFWAAAVFSDLDTAIDIASSSNSSSVGACQYLTNTTNGNNFTLVYNCTGTALQNALVQLNVTDGYGANASSSVRGNSFPNEPPTMSYVKTNASVAVIAGNALNCTGVGEYDLDSDPLTYHYEWYNNSLAMGYDSWYLGGDNVTDGTRWGCSAYVTDGYANSSVFTSEIIEVGGAFPPIIYQMNATTADTGILSNNTFPSNNNTWLNLSLLYDFAYGNNATAYFSTSPNFNLAKSNASGVLLCRSNYNISGAMLSCQYNLSGHDGTVVPFYGFVEQNNSLYSAASSSTFEINHPPALPSLTSPTGTLQVNNTLLTFTLSDSDGDKVNLTIYNSTDGVNYGLLYSGNSTTYNWTNLLSDTYYIIASSIDQHGYGLNFNSSVYTINIDYVGPVLTGAAVSTTTPTTADSVTFSINAADAGTSVAAAGCAFTLRKSDYNFGSGLGSPYNQTTTTKAGDVISFPLSMSAIGTGTLEWRAAYCTDVTGYSTSNSSIGINLTITASGGSSSSSSGGGGSSPDHEVSVDYSNITMALGFCGDSLCSEARGETPLTCSQDCVPEIFNLDKILCEPFLDCGNWKTSWFINFLVIGLVASLVIFTQGKKKKGRRPRI